MIQGSLNVPLSNLQKWKLDLSSPANSLTLEGYSRPYAHVRREGLGRTNLSASTKTSRD